MLTHLVNLIKDRIGAEHAACIAATFVTFRQERVLVVSCIASPRPVFLNTDRDDLFFVRLLAATTELTARQAQQYITNRFTN